MSMTDFLNSNDNNNRTRETAQLIEITNNTVKFGSSVYQFRNVTGFRVGKIPKNKFPFQLVMILTIGGTLTVALVIGWFLLLLALFLVFRHFTQTQYYGLSLFLNSGQERFFVSSDRKFLNKIVSILYDFMENNRDEAVYIDMSNRSVQVGGDFHGNAVTGDDNKII